MSVMISAIVILDKDCFVGRRPFQKAATAQQATVLSDSL